MTFLLILIQPCPTRAAAAAAAALRPLTAGRFMAKRKKASDYSSDEDSASDFEPSASTKRPPPAVSSRRKRRSTAATRKSRHFTADESLLHAEALDDSYANPHSSTRHSISSPRPMRASLLEWYAGVHEVRRMPWRRPFDPSLDADARAQRAYEVRYFARLVCVPVDCSNGFFFHA